MAGVLRIWGRQLVKLGFGLVFQPLVRVATPALGLIGLCQVSVPRYKGVPPWPSETGRQHFLTRSVFVTNECPNYMVQLYVPFIVVSCVFYLYVGLARPIARLDLLSYKRLSFTIPKNTLFG